MSIISPDTCDPSWQTIRDILITSAMVFSIIALIAAIVAAIVKVLVALNIIVVSDYVTLLSVTS